MFNYSVEATRSYIENKQFKKAFGNLQTLFAQEEGINKLLSIMLKIRYQIETNDSVDATVTCVEMVSMFKQINLRNQPTTVMNELHDEMKLLVKRFVEINVDSSLLLLSCRFDLIVGFFNGQTRLEKLRSIGIEMQKIAKELKKQNKRIDIKQQYPVMEKILKEMQRIGDVDLKVKCEAIAWFLKYYGFCCNKAADYDKSIEIHKQAISLMESTFGDNANHYRVLGHCYNNLGSAYEDSNKLVEAKQYYETAVKVYKEVKDCDDENQKMESISFTSRLLEDVEAKLKK